MNFLELMKSRYTTKVYDSSKKISDADLEELKSVLQLSASAINCQPWQFTIVKNETKKEELAIHSRHNKDKVLNASHIIIFSVLDNIELFEKNIEDYLPEPAINYYNTYVKTLKQEEIKAWLAHQVYISLGFFLSACANMGIDSTSMEGIDNDEYRRVADTKEYYPLFAVAIGYRDQDDFNQIDKKPKTRLDKNLTFREI